MNNDDDFEVLISNEDYRIMEKRTIELQEQVKELNKEKSELKQRILKFKEENDNLSSLSKILQENQQYLSSNGLQMARKLLDLEKNNSELMISVSEQELHFSEQYKESLLINKKLESSQQQLLKELNTAKSQLNDILSIERINKQCQAECIHIICSQTQTQTQVISLNQHQIFVQSIVQQAQNDNKRIDQQFRKQKQNLSEKISKLEKQNSLAKSDFKKVNQEMKAKQQQLMGKLIISAEQNGKLNVEIQKLKAILLSHQEKIQKIAHESSLMSQQKERLNKQIQKIKHILKLSEQSSLIIKKQLDATKNQKQSFSQQIASLKQCLKKNQQALLNKNKIIQSLKGSQQKMNVEISQLRYDNRQLTKRLQQCKLQIQNMHINSTMSLSNTLELKTAHESLKEQNKALKESNQDLSADCKKLIEENCQINSQISQLSLHIKDLQQNNSKLIQNLGLKQVEIRKLIEEKEIIINKLFISQKNCSQLEDSRQTLQEQYENIIGSMRKQHEIITQELKAYKNKQYEVSKRQEFKKVETKEEKHQKNISLFDIENLYEQYLTFSMSGLCEIEGLQNKEINELIINEKASLLKKINRICEELQLPNNVEKSICKEKIKNRQNNKKQK